MTLEINSILKDFIGNETSASNVIKSFNNSHYCGVWLLKGQKGIGKAKLASSIISKLLQIENKNNLNELIHPDLFILKHNKNDTKFISVENVRKISSFLSKTSIKGPFKAVLIDSLSEMNLFGYNALLKTIEEYNMGTSFFLIDHMISKIPTTIYSRCKTFTFKNIDNKKIQAFMNTTNIKKEEHYSYSILANGSITATTQSNGSIVLSAANSVFNEYIGEADGSNTRFTLDHTPTANKNISVFVNGQLQMPATDITGAPFQDYSVTGSVIFFVTASLPPEGSLLMANYTTNQSIS